jgi:hypothetical protein
MAQSDAPVEKKVWSASALALLAAVVVAILNAVVANNTLLAGLPPVVQALLLVIIPPILTFLGGYVAPHTNRNELAERGGLPPQDPKY